MFTTKHTNRTLNLQTIMVTGYGNATSKPELVRAFISHFDASLEITDGHHSNSRASDIWALGSIVAAMLCNDPTRCK